ncbi:putative Harmonin [Hypsibius exemplaris]|uniref:Harmonin n=1 Tax=Hypsibius exemplaris TaxID=2072580 RepID=A0A1W0WRI2_HYPEX|nr:putative Harmonin [Hypsibius exemplaris]
MAVTVTVPDRSTRYGWDFDKAIFELFPSYPSREYFRKVLRQYEIGFISAAMFARRLVELVNEPANMKLFDLCRPAVRLEDQLEYSLALPAYNTTKTDRLILERRYLGEDFGFRASGGRDQDCAIVVSSVDRDGIAWQAGVRPGLHITRINGLSTARASHRMFADFVRISLHLELHVKNIGMIPRLMKNRATRWQFPSAQELAGRLLSSHQIVSADVKFREPVIFVKTLQGTVLGAHVRISTRGLMVTALKPGSAAVTMKLKPGDEIIEVNGKRLDGLDFQEAVAHLRCEEPFTLRIRRIVI